MSSASRVVILRTVTLAALMVVAIGEALALAAGEPDAIAAKGKALYRSAAYDEALTVLARAESPEAMQYRALCLLAIGRPLEARAAVEWLIRHAPTFTPDRDLPPRFISVFDDTRAGVLPEVLQALFAAARQNFDARSYADARRGFDEIAALASDADRPGADSFADIGAEATDYIRRIDAAFAPKAEPPVAVATPTLARTASIVPRPAITAPVVLQQTLPPWPAGAVPRATRVATVRVVIGSDGRVRRASIERRIHPQFDQALLAAARSWTYVPAMMDGQPIDIEKVVEVKLP